MKKSKINDVTLFYSYSHKDEKLRDELEAHLSSLRRVGIITEWHDRKILPGQQWNDEITNHLEKSNIILFLVSADFINSEYCYCNEVNRALERHKNQEAHVIPIIIRPVHWQALPFGKLQALPKDGKAVTTWANREEAWVNVVDGICKVVEFQKNVDDLKDEQGKGHSIKITKSKIKAEKGDVNIVGRNYNIFHR